MNRWYNQAHNAVNKKWQNFRHFFQGRNDPKNKKKVLCYNKSPTSLKALKHEATNTFCVVAIRSKRLRLISSWFKAGRLAGALVSTALDTLASEFASPSILLRSIYVFTQPNTSQSKTDRQWKWWNRSEYFAVRKQSKKKFSIEIYHFIILLEHTIVDFQFKINCSTSQIERPEKLFAGDPQVASTI